MEERIDFIEELLLQAEQADQEKKIEMDRLRADQILAAISKLEEGMAEVTDLCEQELKLIEEYRAAYGLRAVINRCGVIAGPWQMGKADQGVFTYWMLAHHFRRPLHYIGFGGSGKQVRDLLHVKDLIELIDEQLEDPGRWDGKTVNVGGGRECSLSLRETTALCAEITGHRIVVGADPVARPGDVPIYISDCGQLHSLTAWRPRHSPRQILADTHEWMRGHETALLESL